MTATSIHSAPALRARLPGLLAWLALLLAALWCVWMAVQLVWALFTPLAPTSSSPTSSPAPVASTTVDVSSISRWHLFGNGNANALRRDILQASQATKLKLTLHGTVAGENDQRGYALIADASGIEHSYRVGERIQEGVNLKAVRADHVILDHNGNNERLDLPRESLDSAAAVRPLGQTGGTLTNNPARERSRRGGKDRTTPIYVAPRIASGRVDWQKMRTQFQRDPAEAISRLNIQPVFDNGRMHGVRLGGGAGNPLLAGSGLRADDVVTAVNGTPLDSVARGQQLFKQLQNARQVKVTVLRGGHSQTLTINLNQAQ